MNNICELFDFIKSSPTPYHTIYNTKRILEDKGFTELSEADTWELESGKSYFVTRGGSSLIAFTYNSDLTGFNIVASHSDSPAFRLKSLGERIGAYTTLDTERYGGAVLYTWFDRPLSLAGRVVISTESGTEVRLVALDTTLVIPSVAPHLDGSVNQSFAPNPAKDMLPLYTLGTTPDALLDEVSAALDVERDRILSSDLVLYCSAIPTTVGRNSELVLSPRLDDLAAVYTSLSAFLASEKTDATCILAIFDNEEVGSETMMGAASTFLSDTLYRIAGDKESLLRSLPGSFMVSCDNAHAIHPAHPELSDPNNAPILGHGVAIKYNANHRYTTDAISEGIFRAIANSIGMSLQTYANRADLAGGSTLGSIASTKVSVNAIDIGIPELAMHSAVETAAVSDIFDMYKLLRAFYSFNITATPTGYQIKK